MPEQLGTNQDQNTLTYLGKLGVNLLDSVAKKFSNPRTARRNRFILLFVTALMLTVPYSTQPAIFIDRVIKPEI